MTPREQAEIGRILAKAKAAGRVVMHRPLTEHEKNQVIMAKPKLKPKREGEHSTFNIQRRTGEIKHENDQTNE